MELIYQTVYLIIVSVILFQALKAPSLSLNKEGKSVPASPLCIMMIILLVLFIGFRPRSVGADTCQYMDVYSYLKGKAFVYDPRSENIIFNNLMRFIGSLDLDISCLFSIMATIYFGCMYIACKKLFSSNQKIAFFSCLIAFSTFSYGVNGMKAGAAASIFLVALSYKDKYWLTIVLALLSLGIHHSMIMVVYAYIIAFIFRNTKWYFIGWLFCLFIAAAHIGYFQSLFASYADESGASYLLAKGDIAYVTGFRIDFILYSAAPIVIGYYVIFKCNLRDSIYELWLRMYLLTNGIWMLCMYASFTNRIAYLSWFLFPIVILYPFYAMPGVPNRSLIGRKVAAYQAYFTLFMFLVYYGLANYI